MDILGITEEDAQRYAETKKTKGRRDQRVCVCGHGGNSHYATDGSNTPVDNLNPGEVSCQAGRVPCLCNQFKWVLTMSDIRSFIQKTTGPGPDHALAKGLVSSLSRGLRPEWREGIRCFWCKGDPREVGTLVPIAYNEVGGEAMRSTPDNRLHCQTCRVAIQTGDFSGQG